MTGPRRRGAAPDPSRVSFARPVATTTDCAAQLGAAEELASAVGQRPCPCQRHRWVPTLSRCRIDRLAVERGRLSGSGLTPGSRPEVGPRTRAAI